MIFIFTITAALRMARTSKEGTSDMSKALSFDAVYEEHFAFVWRTARALGVPPASIDDAVQGESHQNEGDSQKPTRVAGRAARRRAAPRERANSASPEPTATPNDDALLREISLIRSASRAIRQNKPEKALRLLKTYDDEFPEGVMREERDGLRVLALCRLGRRAEAEQAKQQFLRQSPSSPMASRIRDNCEEPERKND
jgi:hypothetical protein